MGGVDEFIRDVALEGFLLAFLELFLFLLDLISILIELLLPHQEDVASVLMGPRVPTQDVASVPALVLIESLLQQPVEEVIWEPHHQGVSVYFLRVLVLRPVLLDLLHDLILQLLHLPLDLLAELIRLFILFLGHLQGSPHKVFHLDQRDIVVLSQVPPIHRLPTSWRPRQEDLHRIQVPRPVELFVEHSDVFDDATFAMPRELQELGSLFLVISIIRRLPILESHRTFHLQVYRGQV
mmetsp:Transcript_432/g.479  ORF Transcript_432/g.479 Transcript_432/m.479 type:complete len:238 (+) Transcript_432:699-1412(+)